MNKIIVTVNFDLGKLLILSIKAEHVPFWDVRLMFNNENDATCTFAYSGDGSIQSKEALQSLLDIITENYK